MSKYVYMTGQLWLVWVGQWQKEDKNRQQSNDLDTATKGARIPLIYFKVLGVTGAGSEIHEFPDWMEVFGDRCVSGRESQVALEQFH